jgi:LuxR family maltose regulon positive regulatory protein
MNTSANVQVEVVRPAELQQQSELLLSTKLYVPRLRQQFVARSHLIERLSQAMKHALILISAPPGFGKTTLLAQWLAQSSLPVAWLSLDAQDNDPNSFLRYVIAALQRLDAHIGATALALLGVPQPVPAETVLARIINDVASRELEDFALVLDDYHLIEAEPIHRSIIFLLRHLPPQMHLVLSTRTDPPLPLARLRARGQLSELRAAQLRFDAAEVKAFVSGMIGLDLADEDIVTLQSRTEGWVAGLQFAALSLRQHGNVAGFVASFTGSNHLVLDYLCEEVLSQQSAEVQSFLLHTCILERLSGPLCDAIRGSPGSQAMLEALERANVFMVSLDGERSWYRYHHLFAQVLRNCLQQTEPELLPELHRRASAWYQQQGLIVEAIQHLLEVPDLEGVADLVEQHAVSVSGWGQAHMVLGWLRNLPEALVRTRPFLCIIHALILAATKQLQVAEARLRDAERAIHSDTPAQQVRAIQGQMAIIRANMVRFAGDVAGYVALAQQALALLPETEVLWRAAGIVYAADAYLVSGDVTSANEGLLATTIASMLGSVHPFILLRSLTLLARLQGLQGKLRWATSAYEQTVQQIGGQEVLKVLPGSSAYCFGLGNLLREENRLEEAERLLLQGMELLSGPLMAFADDVLLGYTALARLYQARGDYSKALATLDTFIQIAGERHFIPWLLASAVAVRVQVELVRGDLAAASDWAEQCGLSLEDEELSYLREREYLTLVRVCIAQTRAGHTQAGSRAHTVLPQVLLLLERLREQAESNARMNSVIEVLILQALALQAQGEDTGALAALERVLVLAEPEGYMRVFLDEGAPLVALLRQASARGIATNYVLSLVAASGEQVDTHQRATSAEPLLEPLTQREREVLGLLMQGASNRQMARDLVLSVGTIKKYVYIICGKLGVQSRTQAVIKARMLNLSVQ